MGILKRQRLPSLASVPILGTEVFASAYPKLPSFALVPKSLKETNTCLNYLSSAPEKTLSSEVPAKYWRVTKKYLKPNCYLNKT